MILQHKVQPPEGFELLPGDLGNPSALHGEGGSEEAVGEQQVGQMAEGEAAEVQLEGGKDREEEGGTSGRDMVFLCVKVGFSRL